MILDDLEAQVWEYYNAGATPANKRPGSDIGEKSARR